MLNFRNTTILFCLLFVVLVAIQYNRGFDVSWFIALFLLYTAVIFYGSFYIRSDFFIKTYSGVKTDKKVIALSFDDGPSKELTPIVLQILAEHKVPATFFLIGEKIDEAPELVQQAFQNGHLLGNHTYYHSNWFDLQSSKKMKEEMQQTHNLVHQLTGKQMNWFRPPYGVTNPNVKKAVEAMGYQSVGWNLRSLDTMIKDRERLLARLKQLIKPGAVVLLHDTMKLTVEVLPAIIEYVKAEGYEVIGLDKLLNLQPYRENI